MEQYPPYYNINFSTRDFLIGLSIKNSSSLGYIYKNALDLGNHKSIHVIFHEGLSNIINEQEYPYGIYERAIELYRRSIFPYNQIWTVELMYS